MKRVFDVAVSVVALVFLSPLLVSIGLVVRIQLGRPILFRQIRPGLCGVPFELIKFRTMRPVLEADGRTTDEQRMTGFGAWLRSTSLDELPELWNVLKGDMSLVGPRPLLMEYLSLYNDYQARRHEVRPGITGWAQVNGRNTMTWSEKFKLDVWYVDNRSFGLDCKILLLTFWKVIAMEGITSEGHPTGQRFRGNP
jgi:lipopolysaccharide/colanic/teichoic acid biosynthesis glycosyltransferase